MLKHSLFQRFTLFVTVLTSPVSAIDGSKMRFELQVSRSSLEAGVLSFSEKGNGTHEISVSEASECIFEEEQANRRVFCTDCVDCEDCSEAKFFKNAQICVETFETARRAPLGVSHHLN